MVKFAGVIASAAAVAGAPALAPVVSAAPTISLLAPSQGAVIQGTAVTVHFHTNGLRMVQPGAPTTPSATTASGGEPQGQVNPWLELWPVAVVGQGDSYTFTNVPTGEHVLRAELTASVVQAVRSRTESSLTQAAAAAMPTTGVGWTADNAVGPGTALAVLALCAALYGAAGRSRA